MAGRHAESPVTAFHEPVQAPVVEHRNNVVPFPGTFRPEVSEAPASPFPGVLSGFVSIELRVYPKNGARHVYGMEAKAKGGYAARHLSHDTILDAYGAEKPDAAHVREARERAKDAAAFAAFNFDRRWFFAEMRTWDADNAQEKTTEAAAGARDERWWADLGEPVKTAEPTASVAFVASPPVELPKEVVTAKVLEIEPTLPVAVIAQPTPGRLRRIINKLTGRPASAGTDLDHQTMQVSRLEMLYEDRAEREQEEAGRHHRKVLKIGATAVTAALLAGLTYAAVRPAGPPVEKDRASTPAAVAPILSPPAAQPEIGGATTDVAPQPPVLPGPVTIPKPQAPHLSILTGETLWGALDRADVVSRGEIMHDILRAAKASGATVERHDIIVKQGPYGAGRHRKWIEVNGKSDAKSVWNIIGAYFNTAAKH